MYLGGSPDETKGACEHTASRPPGGTDKGQLTLQKGTVPSGPFSPGTDENSRYKEQDPSADLAHKLSGDRNDGPVSSHDTGTQNCKSQ